MARAWHIDRTGTVEHRLGHSRNGSVDLKRLGAGPVLYGVLFSIVLPAGLVAWAVVTANQVGLPLIPYGWAGVPMALIGTMLMVSGWIALAIFGHGLPMNAYPPREYVTRGIYRYLEHPIYVGFALLVFGVALHSGSASGQWLVSPMIVVAMAALVLGYERHALRARFGDNILKPLVALPPDCTAPPTKWNRASVFVLVFLPWSVAYELVYRLGIPPDAIDARFLFERSWPVLQWSEAVYGSVYTFVMAAPLLVCSQSVLRRFALRGLTATALVTLIYLTVPLVSPPRAFEPQGVLGRMLMFERSMSHTVAAFPAFHFIWSLIAAEALATRSRSWAVFAWTWASMIGLSCLTTGMHALLDIIAAVAAFLVIRYVRSIWRVIREVAERIANSWREWRWRGIRLLNYAFYAGLAAAVGFWISTGLGGPTVFWQLVFIHVIGLLGAAVWAQQLEGSPKLSRPFGYYGSVSACVLGTLLAGTVTGQTLLLFAVISTEAPWVQAIGRLRCLVQGCCHGSEAPAGIGIRYNQPKSRVCSHTDLGGVPLHPTPVYSILANIVIGVLLLRLWSIRAPLGVITGAYLMLAGATRFVEESYRGEPQTPRVAGLSVYQWMAVLSFVGGIVFTSIPGSFPSGMRFTWDERFAIGGLVYGLITACAMGVDFPGSVRRLARLAPP